MQKSQGSSSLPQTRGLGNARFLSECPDLPLPPPPPPFVIPNPPPQLGNDVSFSESGAQKQNKPRARGATRSARARRRNRTTRPPTRLAFLLCTRGRRDARALCAASRKQQRERPQERGSSDAGPPPFPFPFLSWVGDPGPGREGGWWRRGRAPPPPRFQTNPGSLQREKGGWRRRGTTRQGGGPEFAGGHPRLSASWLAGRGLAAGLGEIGGCGGGCVWHHVMQSEKRQRELKIPPTAVGEPDGQTDMGWWGLHWRQDY